MFWGIYEKPIKGVHLKCLRDIEQEIVRVYGSQNFKQK